MTSTGVRNEPVGAGAARALDRLLRRLMRIEEYCRRPDCLFRVALIRSPEEVTLADGTHVRRGEPVGDLHYWNEHMPTRAEGGPAVAWALATDRGVRRSLAALAEFVEADPRYRAVRAILGEMGGLPVHGARMLAATASRYGFEPRPVEPPRGWVARLRRWGEGVLLLLLARAYNPASLERRGAKPTRRRLWMSRATLLARYGRPPSDFCQHDGSAG